MKIRLGAALSLLGLWPLSIAAQEAPIDEIVVGGDADAAPFVQVDVDKTMIVDTAAALRDLPGANINSNGGITGIAQYRGMFGDRVAVDIDNHAVVSGGPNAMDAPLSYVSPMITESLTIERGIVSVSSAPESIGGRITASLARGSFGAGEPGVSGFVGSRYSNNGNLATTAGRLTLANAAHRVTLLGEFDNGNDRHTPAGEVRPSAVDRERYDVSYAFTDGSSHVVVFAGRLDTTDTGTPALPMDIRFIETDLFGGHFLYARSDRFSLEGRVSVNDVAHLMDNFGLRQAPSPMMQRQNFTTGEGRSYAVAGVFRFPAASLRVGSHGMAADHAATITNPNNASFRIANFVDVERDLVSLFAEFTVSIGAAELETGVSLKRVEADSGEVSASGVMGNAIGMLADAFNQSPRGLTFDDVDAVIKVRHSASDAVDLHLEMAQKSRAPSYQELYLWAPMQATGGLADGRTYIGNLSLESEISREWNVGVDISGSRFAVSPQFFYKRINGYIQGAPSTNAAANMAAMMMNGAPALQFANTDAEIWGFDAGIRYVFTDRLTADGTVTYARGRRTDVPDHLYRLAPLNGSIALTYAAPTWSLGTRLHVAASQDRVSAYNSEQPTDGYEVLDLLFAWTPTDAIRVEAQVSNLLDETYQDHLGGINRANGSDIAVGERLYGYERSLSAGFVYSF